MDREVRIRDATSAHSVARRHLEAHYGANKIKDIKFTRAWYSTGAKMDVWEVEGDVMLKKGIIGKEIRHFKYQIDPTTGSVMGMGNNKKNTEERRIRELLEAVTSIIIGLIMLGLGYLCLKILLFLLS